MSIFRQFQTSAKHETEGVWLDYGPDSGRVRVARAGGNNKNYLRAMEKLTRKYKRQLQLDVLSREVQEKIMREVTADTIVTDWEIKGHDGEPIPGDRASIVKTFEELPDFFNDVLTQAQNTALFREHIDEVDAGNS